MLRIALFIGIGLFIVGIAQGVHSDKGFSFSSIMETFEKVGEGTYNKFKEWTK